MINEEIYCNNLSYNNFSLVKHIYNSKRKKKERKLLENFEHLTRK